MQTTDPANNDTKEARVAAVTLIMHRALSGIDAPTEVPVKIASDAVTPPAPKAIQP